MEPQTIQELRRNNRSSIFHLIYRERRISKQSIASLLNLSLPTVAQNLKELEQLRLVERNGYFESSGGRKAQIISCIQRCRVAIGVEVLRHQIQIVAVDIYGEMLRQDELDVEYQNGAAYYRRLGDFVNGFIEQLRLAPARVLGVGITLQGLVSPNGQYMTYGEVLGCTGAHLSDIARHIAYPCRLIHDSEAAAFAELWFSGSVEDALYLSLSKSLGSAVIMNGRLHRGKGAASGLVEHIVVQPGGNLCYCGKCGCLETYCSVNALLREGERLEDFFAAVNNGLPGQAARWDDYLDLLAAAIDNIRLVVDCDIILGGHIAPFLTDRDITTLHQLVNERATFPEERAFIRIGACTIASIETGAALMLMRDFLDSV